jgi:hypothetical protein
MKIKNILLLFVIGIALCSCNKVSDWLEKQNTGDLKFEDIWEDENYVEGWLNNCLAAVPGQGWVFSGGEPLWGLTDEGWSSLDAANGASRIVYDGNFSSASWPGARNLYAGLLYSIRNINIFLHYIVLPETPVKSEDNRRRMIADAYVIRAYYMFELFKEYGPLYLYNEDGATEEESNPHYLNYITDLTDSYVNLRRVSAEDYINWILADCDRGLAIDDLPWRATSPNMSTRMTKSLAWAIKARAMMWLASPLFNDGKDYWEDAYKMNKEAIKVLREHGFELFSECTNTSKFGEGNGNAFRQYHCTAPDYRPTPIDKETIFAYGGASGNYAANYIGSKHTGTGTCGICPTQEMVDCYETIDGVPVLDLANPYKDQYHTQPNFNPDNTLYNDQHPYENRDPRFEECIMHHGTPYFWDKAYTMDISSEGRNFRSTLPTEISQTRTGYYFCKTIPPDCTLNAPTGGAAPKQYKFSELLLDFAECAVESGHLQDAIDAVNEIRERVKMPPLPVELVADKDALRLRVYNERRVEFAFEETRYFDLRRRCRPEEEIPGIKYFSAMDVTYAGDWAAATYTRVPLREAIRHGFEPQCKLSPIPKGEASNLKNITGVNFQNYGWD